MRPELILQPVVAMLLLTFVVWLRLYFTRVPAMRRQRVHPQKIATRAEKALVHLSDAEARASDNFSNQFELPVLFYVLCLALYVTGRVDMFYLAFAWAFVVLRVAHSAVHVLYNRVLHRFLAYFAGGIVLFAMAFRFAFQIFA